MFLKNFYMPQSFYMKNLYLRRVWTWEHARIRDTAISYTRGDRRGWIIMSLETVEIGWSVLAPWGLAVTAMILDYLSPQCSGVVRCSVVWRAEKKKKENTLRSYMWKVIQYAVFFFFIASFISSDRTKTRICLFWTHLVE